MKNAYESVAVSNTPTGLNESVYADVEGRAAQRAWVNVETAQVRFRRDGTDPTAASGGGVLAGPGDVIELTGIDEISRFKAIRATTTDAMLSVEYSHTMPERA